MPTPGWLAFVLAPAGLRPVSFGPNSCPRFRRSAVLEAANALNKLAPDLKQLLRSFPPDYTR